MKILAGTMMTSLLEVRLLKRREHLGAFADLSELRRRAAELPYVPHIDWSDFGRGSNAVRCLMLAAALTAGDSGAPLPENTGIIGWNGSGCTAENQRFWQDYIQNGRENGRGGLFVATLPTIPFCEAAIALGCRGPSAYLRTDNSTVSLFRLLTSRPKGIYLAGEITGENTVCMLLTESDGILPDLPDFPDLAGLFLHLEGNT